MSVLRNDLPTDLLHRYSGVFEYDWAAKMIDPEAHEKYETGDGFERLQYVHRLMASRHIAASIILTERERHAPVRSEDCKKCGRLRLV